MVEGKIRFAALTSPEEEWDKLVDFPALQGRGEDNPLVGGRLRHKANVKLYC